MRPRVTKKAKREVAIARGQVQDKMYESLESPTGQKDLYRLAKMREKNDRDVMHVKCIKDDNGKVLLQDEEINFISSSCTKRSLEGIF